MNDTITRNKNTIVSMVNAKTFIISKNARNNRSILGFFLSNTILCICKKKGINIKYIKKILKMINDFSTVGIYITITPPFWLVF